jgi:hypothetical protein
MRGGNNSHFHDERPYLELHNDRQNRSGVAGYLLAAVAKHKQRLHRSSTRLVASTHSGFIIRSEEPVASVHAQSAPRVGAARESISKWSSSTRPVQER